MDCSSPLLTQTLAERSGPVADITFSPNGRILASGSCDSSVKLWDVFTGQRIRSLFGYPLGVNAVAISPQGDLLAVGAPDGSVDLWKILTGEHILSLQGQGRITAITFTPQAKTLISACDASFCDTIFASPARDNCVTPKEHSGSINIWDLRNAKLLYSFGDLLEPVNALALSTSGKTLATGHRNSKINIWSINSSPKLRYTLDEHDDAIYAVAVSPDGNLVASGSGDKQIKVWHLQSRNLYLVLEGHQDTIYDVTFSPDSHYLASSSADGTISLWDIKTGHKISTLQAGERTSLNTIAFSPDGNFLAGGSGDGTIKIWKINDEKLSPLPS